MTATVIHSSISVARLSKLSCRVRVVVLLRLSDAFLSVSVIRSGSKFVLSTKRRTRP